MMATVRNTFHELGNWHNKISLAAMVTREALETSDWSTLTPEEQLALHSRAIKAFTQIEGFVLGADQTVQSFKNYIYKQLDPDCSMTEQVDQG
jgi:hypothetical protein